MESKQQDNARHEVLSGWKDIARYLGKAVRTVQRYERELGLPVRRHSGSRSGSVVTTESDLDSWVKSSATVQESLNKRTVTIQAYLSSEVEKGRRDRAVLHAQIKALRKELKASVRMLGASILKLRQELDETRLRQGSIASVIGRYSKVRQLLSDVKHRNAS